MLLGMNELWASGRRAQRAYYAELRPILKGSPYKSPYSVSGRCRRIRPLFTGRSRQSTFKGIVDDALN